MTKILDMKGSTVDTVKHKGVFYNNDISEFKINIFS